MPRARLANALIALALAPMIDGCAGAVPRPAAAPCSREAPAACAEEAVRLRGDASRLAERRRLLGLACDGGVGPACLELGESYAGSDRDAYLARSAFDQGCARDVGRACFRAVEHAREPEGNLQLRMEVDAKLAKACKLGDLPGCARLGARRVAEGAEERALEVLTPTCGALGREGTTTAALADPLDERARADACGALGGLLLAGAGAPKDAPRGLSLSRAACDHGAASTCAALAVRARDGDGVPRELGAARTYAERACALGEPRGCVTLGAMLGAGEGGAADPRRGEALLRASCEREAGALRREACDARGELLRGLGPPAWMATHVPVPDPRVLDALFDAAAPRPLADGAPTTLICRLQHTAKATHLEWQLGPLSRGERFGVGERYVFVAAGIDLRKGDAVFVGLSETARGGSIGGLGLAVPLPIGLGGVDVTSWPLAAKGAADALPIALRADKGSVECRGLADDAVERAIAPGLAALAKLEARPRTPSVRLDKVDLGYEDSTAWACEEALHEVAALAGWAHPRVRGALPGVLEARAAWLAAARGRLPALIARAKPAGDGFGVDAGKGVARLRGVACDAADPEAPRYYGACAATFELEGTRSARADVALAVLPSCTAIRADGRTASLLLRGGTDPSGKEASRAFTVALAKGERATFTLRAPYDDGPRDPKKWAVAIRCGDALVRVPSATPDPP